MIIAMLIAAAAPSAEALTLSQEVAEGGMLATILPVLQKKETEELIDAHPELSAAEKARLRATSERVYATGRKKLMDADARAWASHLDIADLRAIAAFQRSEAGKHYRSAIPQVVAATMQSAGTFDFKGDVLAAYCKDTGKLCAK